MTAGGAVPAGVAKVAETAGRAAEVAVVAEAAGRAAEAAVSGTVSPSEQHRGHPQSCSSSHQPCQPAEKKNVIYDDICGNTIMKRSSLVFDLH